MLLAKFYLISNLYPFIFYDMPQNYVCNFQIPHFSKKNAIEINEVLILGLFVAIFTNK